MTIGDIFDYLEEVISVLLPLFCEMRASESMRTFRLCFFLTEGPAHDTIGRGRKPLVMVIHASRLLGHIVALGGRPRGKRHRYM